MKSNSVVFQYVACIYCLFTQSSTKNLNILGEAQPFKVDKVPVTGPFMVLTSGFSLFQGSYCSSSLDAPCHSLRNINLKVRHLCSPGLRTVCQFLRAKCSSCQDTGFYFQEKHSLYEKFSSPYLRTLPHFKFFVFVIF